MFAYVADVATPAERTRYFGLLAGAGAIGTVLGPGLGGLLGEISARAPFWAAAVVGLVNAVYGFLILRESLPRSARASFSWARANPFSALWILFEGKGLLGLAVIMFLANVAFSAFASIYVLYVTYRYHWGSGEAGAVLTAFAAASIVAQGLLAGPVSRWLGERGAVIAAFACGASGLVIIGLAVWTPLLWIGVIAVAPVNIGIAAIQSLRSKRVDASEQGRLQGAMISLGGLAGMVGPVAFAGIFAWSAGAGQGLHLPGLAMLIGAGVFVLAIGLTLVVISPKPRGVDSSGRAAEA
jgi:DHA1 family tetracycline resistance protein-like MFS transporter